MKQSDFETQLRTALHTPTSQSMPPELSAKLRQEMKRAARFEPVRFGAFLRLQVKFIGWKIWLFQAVLLVLLLGVFWGLLLSPAWNSAWLVSWLLCGFSMLVSAVAVPVVYRSFCYGMHEVEASTYFSAGQVLLAKLLLVGLGDGAMLLGIGAVAAVRSSLGMSSTVLYVLVPYLLGSSGILWLMRHAEASRFLPDSLGLYGLLGIAGMMAKRYLPELFGETLSAPWILVLVVLAVFGWYQLNQILRKTTYAELQLM